VKKQRRIVIVVDFFVQLWEWIWLGIQYFAYFALLGVLWM